MAYLDDDQGASAQAARQAAADARANALTARDVTALALEIDSLAALTILKSIQFGQTREGFLRSMGDRFDQRLLAFERMEVGAKQLVQARLEARIGRMETEMAAERASSGTADAPQDALHPAPPAIVPGPACTDGMPGCTIPMPHDHAGTDLTDEED